MIRNGCAIGAIYALAQGSPDSAVVWALLAIAFAIPRAPGLVRSWLGWDEAVSRAEDDATLFRGSRDD